MIEEMKISDLDEIMELEKDLFKEDAWKKENYLYEFI